MQTYDGQGRRVETLDAIPRCVILNSRQSKRPCNRDSWLTSTRQAVEFAKGQGYGLVTSVGLNTWELVVHLANTAGMDQAIVIPSADADEAPLAISQISESFRLDPAKCHFVAVDSTAGSSRKSKKDWHQRDERTIEIADLILPVSIRPGGNLERQLAEAISSGKQTYDDFRVPYQKPVDQLRYDLQRRRLNPAIEELGQSSVIHWTRSSHSPYSGETRYDYYQNILSSKTYPHSAYHTLSRILTEGMIRGSARFIRGGCPVVAFSSLPPSEAIALMRWRRRYVYYSFEPYGIAIRRDAAEAVGIRPVIYGEAVRYDSLGECDRPFFQNQGTEDADWRPEHEWRHLGDLDLRKVASSDIRYITYTESEAVELRPLTTSRVVSLTVT